MPDAESLTIAVLTAAVVTFAMRALPFATLSRWAAHPVFCYLSWSLPPAIMLLLLLFSLRWVELMRPFAGVPELIGILVVAALHLWRRNAMLSVGAGMVLYIVLTKTVFS